MIVNGKVSTINGYIDIKNLNIGDYVLNRRNRRILITDIKLSQITNIITFIKDPEIILSDDTVLNTIYGKKKIQDLLDDTIYFLLPNGKIEKEKYIVTELETPVIGYQIILETPDSYYVNQYSID